VELKPETAAAVAIFDVLFESNQSGIETDNSPFINSLHWVWFESNQSGIETESRIDDQCNRCNQFESNQSGIETS